MVSLLIPVVLVTSLASVSGFYLPGVAPHSFAKSETVELKVNKLRYWTALIRTQFSMFVLQNESHSDEQILTRDLESESQQI